MSSPLPAPSEIHEAAARLGAAIPASLGPDRPTALREAFRKAGEFGIFRATLGRDRGGPGLSGEQALSGTDLADAWEGLGYGCENGGVLFAIGAHALAVVHPLLAHASAEVAARVLPRLLEGTAIGAHAASESGAGSDVMSMATRAVRDGDGWRITGTKDLITNAADADVLLVFAQAEDGERKLGVTGFVVERGTAGLETGAPMAKMGLGDASLGSVYLDGCRVGDEAVLGRVGGGGAVFATAMLWERTLILAPQVGAMRRQLERGIAHARTRRQFGRPIGKNQLVAARVVDLYERYVLARGLLRESCGELAQGTLSPARACLTKLKLSEWALESHLDAIRLHGGSGYVSEAGLEQQLRDAVGGVLYSGTSDMQRVIIAAHLGLG